MITHHTTLTRARILGAAAPLFSESLLISPPLLPFPILFFILSTTLPIFVPVLTIFLPIFITIAIFLFVLLSILILQMKRTLILDFTLQPKTWLTYEH